MSEASGQLSEQRRRLLELRMKGAARSAKPAVKRVSGQPMPLSAAQHQMWIIDQMNPGTAAYHIPVAYRITGALEVNALQDAFNEIIRRHEAWRTTFRELDGRPVQEIHPSCEIPIAVTDLRHLPLSERDAEARAQAADEAIRPFNLQQLPLVRVSLFRIADDDYVLLLNVHHIVADGLSLRLMFHELDALYRDATSGTVASLPPLNAQYADFTAWQQNELSGGRHAKQLEHWRQQLQGELPTLELATDTPRPLHQTFSGSTVSLRIPTMLAQSLNAIGTGERTTFFVTILAAFQILLTRSSRSEEVIIGTPVANRPLPEFEPLLGNFLNIIALRSDLRGDPTFVELLRRCRETTLLALANAEVPFETVVQSLGAQRDPARNPVFQALMQILPHVHPRIGELQLARFDFDARFSQVDLTLYLFEEADGGYFGQIQFCTPLFSSASMGRLVENFVHLLADIACRPTAPISALSILGESQRDLILAKWSGHERPYAEQQTIATRFAECAATTPNGTAVIDGGERLTYAQLDARANRIAHHLQAHGIRPGNFVGLRAERSLAFIVKVLGIAKAGAAYLPLDEDEPAARLATIRAACTHILDAEPEGAFAPGSVGADALPSGPAYVLHTSGSTGTPKGVIVPHTGILRLVVNNDYAPFQPDDVVAFASNPCFDAATFEIWGALLNGATLVVTPRDVLLSPSALATHFEQHRVSVMFLTTSLFNRLAHESPAMFARLRILVFGGEAADAASVRLVLAHGKPQRLVNGYGPTETTTFAICQTIESVDGASIPIGRPIANTRVFLLDPARQPVPIGVPGEIHIGGPGVALGYHGAPELTAEKFIVTEFGRLYRTGDLARWLPDGSIEYLGRIDQQVKLRGFRIEPGEIEAALQQHGQIRQAAIAVHAEAGAAQSLIAYLVSKSADRIDDAQLRTFLSERLPAYMIPSAFVWMEALPLTPNGKLDTRNLPAPDASANRAFSEVVAPRNDCEQRIAAIWKRALGREASSVFEDFFTVGGHSLLALRLLSDVRKEFGIEIPARRLFETPTIAGLAAHMTTTTAPNESAKNFLLSIQRGDVSRRPLFLVAGGWGGEIEFLVYGELSRQIDPSQPVWGLKARGAGTGDPPHATVGEMAADYLREIREIQPHGPYFLAGECVGGICAYEMACQLDQAGEQVALLVLLDTVVPNENHLNNYLAAEEQKRTAVGQMFTVRSRIRYHLWKMSTMPLREKASYLFDKALRRKQPLPPSLEPPPEEHPRGQKDYPITLLKHRLLPYRGKVTLLLDDESAQQNGTLGWEKIPLGGFETHALPGDHFTYIRKNATAAADVLRALIQKATP